VLTHRCHLPPPEIFHELPRMSFSSQTLSTDLRTIRLAQLAVQQMKRVHTLRIIFGHPTLNDALLRCFFDVHRERETPVRKLWLENCRLSAGCQLRRPDFPYGLPTELDFDGLESLRLRRMPLRPGVGSGEVEVGHRFVYARGNEQADLRDGVGGFYTTTVNHLRTEQMTIHEHLKWRAAGDGDSPLEQMYRLPHAWDDEIYRELSTYASVAQNVAISERHEPSHHERSLMVSRGSQLDPIGSFENQVEKDAAPFQREQLPSSQVSLGLLASCSQTLTSLTLDWLFMLPSVPSPSREGRSGQPPVSFFVALFTLRFPHLKAFQFRNAVVPDTLLPRGLYLLDRAHVHVRTRRTGLSRGSHDAHIPKNEQQMLNTACLEFMEAHADLQCLAWPMDHFFSETGPPGDIASRVQAVINNLGRTLTELRVDATFSGAGEPQSENTGHADRGARDRRRRFIEEFASKMKKVEIVKIEGGVPRDERRETLRALHACPLKKIVMIGVCCPLGNTWGAEGRDVSEVLHPDEVDQLEGEDKDAIWKLGPIKPEPVGSDFDFKATYGWPPGPPMANVIAAYHADTVTELKFCGYKGSPVLLSPTPITTPMLAALKHFHHLETLILSLWLTTTFEGSLHDSEIITYWHNARSPSSTALVRITDEEPAGWEKELRTKYAPDALAWRITSLLGPLLSETAKGRRGGVHVRASFCVGVAGGGIFDVDLRVGKGALGNDVCLGYRGPREELEPERRRSKLETRRWF